MMYRSPGPEELSSDLTHGEELCCISALRQDTGETMWLVQSDHQARSFYILTRQGGVLWCPCPDYREKSACEHGAAIHRMLLPQPSQHVPSRSTAPQNTPTAPQRAHSLHPAPRNERERRQAEAAERRKRALLWTDDQPFSIYKS